MSLLGIDVGTSGCKAAVFDLSGQLLGAARAEYDHQRPQPGWAELDTPAVWEQIKTTIRLAVSQAAEPVQALSVSSLGEAVVPVTAGRQILGPSLLNFDSRGAEYLPELAAKLPPERLYRINGNTPGNHYTLTKLLWLQRCRPGLYRQTDWFLHWSGFVAFMLGAEPVVDRSLANRSLLFDLDAGDWSDELLEIAGLDRQHLPPVVSAGRVIGQVAAVTAAELGLPAGIPIISGAHDQCCNGIGCGVIQPGLAMFGMGTFACMMPVFDRRPEAAMMLARGLNTEHHAMPGQYVSFIYNQGGALVRWFRDTFAAAERQAASLSGTDLYASLLAEMPAGPSRLLALPHFTTTGPPNFIADSSGLIAGLKLETPRGEILKALIEGDAFYLRESMESLPDAGIEIDAFRAAGGGSQSSAWIQVLADILGRPFVRLRIGEAGALGAAILAGAGCGVFPSIQAGVERMVQLERQFWPDPTLHARYTERFSLYRRLYPLMGETLQTLAAG